LQQILLGALFALALSAAAIDASAQAPESLEIALEGKAPIRLLRVAHEDTNIDIDGHLSEAIWTRIEPFAEPRVTRPDTLAIPPYATDLRMFYTERGIYVSFDLEQPADTIIERFAPRDAFDVVRDNVGFTLDTSGDGRYGYWFNQSLGNTEMDGTILPERQFGRDWDGAWYGATQRTENGWSAEFYVPWSQMAMPKQDGVRRIGLYMSRNVAHLNERWAWPALPETQSRFISLFQPLELEGVDPRQQWSIFPYTSATLDRVLDNNRYKAGLDVFWRPSTNFQLTATVNPDFGSVESDNVVINLTANENFFPEKRLFFQEGREIFNLSARERNFGQQPITVVNTRRIGGLPRSVSLPDGVSLSRREALKPADIITAAKATGQIGSIRYGVLAAFEDQTDFIADDGLRYSQDGRDFGVFRILYEDSIGAAYRGLGWITTVVAHPEADAVVHGTDFHYLTTSGKWNINGQLLFSDRDDSGTGAGFTTDITYTQRQGLKHEFTTTLLDDTINVNDLGFQIRNNIRDFQYRIRWDKSGLTRIRDFSLTPFLRYEVNGDGFRTNNALAISGDATLNNLTNVGAFFGFFPQRYDDRNSFGNGTFEVRTRTFANVNYSTDESKSFSFSGQIGYRGEFVSGTSPDARLGFSWRPRHNLSMNLEVSYRDIDGWLLHQEGENFTAFKGKQWSPNLNLEFFPSSKQQLRLALQWIGIRAEEDRFFTLPAGTTTLIQGPKPPGDTDSFSISQLNFQVRYRWQIAPLSDLFIVYTRGDSRRVAGLSEFGDLFRDNLNDPLGDQLVIKIRYRLGS